MRMRELSVKGRLARFAHGGAELGGDHAARPAPGAAAGGAPRHRALGLAILWQPKHSCRWQHCPHHGKTVQEEVRLERERHERDASRRGSDR
jgi:hypothetical protein